MDWHTLLHLLPILVSLGISAVIGFHALNQRAPGAKSFGWMAILQASWGVGFLFELVSPNLGSKLFWDNAQWLFTGLIPVVFLVFTLRYTGRVASRPFRLYTILSLPAIVLTLLLYTNDLHGLAIQNAGLIEQHPFSILLYDFTPVTLGFSAYFYILMLAGIVYLLSYFVYSQGFLRIQIYMIIIGSAIPIAGTILSLLGWVPEGMQRDISPYTFAAGNILISLALFRYRMLQAAPLTRNILFEQIREGMIVLDENAHIVDINPAAKNILGLNEVPVFGSAAMEAFRPWPHINDLIRKSVEGQDVLIVGSGLGCREYAFFLSRLNDSLGLFAGHLITLRETEGAPTKPVSVKPTAREDAPPEGQVEAAARGKQKSPYNDILLIRWLRHIFYPPALEGLAIPSGRETIWYQSLERIATGLIRMSFLLIGIIVILNRSVFADFPQAYRCFQVLALGLGVLAVFRSIPFSIRRLGFILILYLFGVTETLIFGFTAEGFNAFLAVIVMAGVLLWGRTRWAVFSFSIATVVALGYVISQGRGIPLAGEDLTLLSYQISRVNSSILSLTGGTIGLSLTTIVIWESASKVWRKERQTSNLLQRERDLLEQRVVERSRELSESEAKYRVLTEILPVVVYRDEINERGSTTYVSPQIEALFGYSQAEWLQDPDFWHKIVLAEDYEHARTSIDQTQKHGHSIVEYRIRTGDARIVWVRDEAILVRDETGQPLYAQGTLSDITSQIEAQNVLRRQGEEYKALSQIAMDLLERRSLDQLLQTAVDQVSFLLDAPFVEISLKEGEKLVVRGFTGNLSLIAKDTVNRQEAKLTWKAVDTREPIIIDNYSEWSEKREKYNPLQLQAVAIFPILKGGECLGTLDVSRSVPGYIFTGNQIQLGKWFTHLFAVMLDNMQLLETANLRASALKAAANAILIANETGVIEWVNPAFTNLTGYVLEEMVGNGTFRSLLSDSISHGLHRDLQSFLEDGKAWKGEIPARRKNGTEYIQEITITPLLNDAGEIFRFIAIMQDITERKLAEDQLRASEERYRLIYENMEDVVYQTDYHGIITAVSPSVTRQAGYSPEELIGWHAKNFYDSPKEFDTLDALIAQKGTLNDHEVLIRKKDGGVVYVSMTVRTIFDSGGNPVGTEGVMRDISERKKAEGNLRRLTDNMQDVVTQISPEGNILYASPSHKWVLGVDPAEVLGSFIFDSIHPDDVEEAFNILSQAYTQARLPGLFALRYQHADGRYLWMECSSKLLTDSTGQFAGAVLSSRDVTQRKEIEAALRESENLYRLLAENSSDVIWVRDMNLRLTYISPAVQRLQDFTVEEALNASLEQTLTPQSAAYAQEFFANIMFSISNLPAELLLNEYRTLELEVLKKDGSTVWTETQVSFLWGDHGEPTGILGVTRDITERRRAADEMQTLNLELETRVIERTLEIQEANKYLSALLETSIILNKNLEVDELLDRVLLRAHEIIKCRAVNLMLVEGDHAYIARRLGYQGLEEIERNLINYKFPLTWPTFQKMISTCLGIFISDTHSEPTWQRIKNSEWVRAYIGVPLAAGGKVIGFLNFSHDQPHFFSPKDIILLEAFANHAAIAVQNSRLLAEVKLSLEKEKELRDRLVQADKLSALGKMVAVIAHEINNPIQTVKNSFYLLEDEVPEGSMGKEYLKIASTEANRISNLVLQLREAYRPRSKHYEIINIPDLLREIHLLLTPQLKKSQVACTQNDPPDLCQVRGIRDNLKQVFLNLTINAIEAMSVNNGGVITVNYVLRDDRTIGVAMNNNGPRIPADALSNIFDPFFTTKESGSGLGLSIAFDIIKQHAGEITVENGIENGVTFTVWLPLADQNQSEQ